VSYPASSPSLARGRGRPWRAGPTGRRARERAGRRGGGNGPRRVAGPGRRKEAGEREKEGARAAGGLSADWWAACGRGGRGKGKEKREKKWASREDWAAQWGRKRERDREMGQPERERERKKER
jgi:hypothetical protein